uniref:Metallo-beta-lactamase domain-containing protein n=1 Tax=Oryza glumipatula TaxID=40148 RepID=A0A0E0BV93_9ORYZ
MAASVPNGHTTATGEGGTPPSSSSSLVFLGTGCSSAVPNARCLIQPPDPPCAVCSQSLSVAPELNPNYRCNTSLLIDYCQDENAHKYILIDVGKTFREQVLRWFVHHKIPCVDSIILTHEHADAILGLDDVRIVQSFSPTNDIEPTPIYLSQFAMDSIAQKFPYLVRKKLKEGEEVRRVAQLDWRVIESDLQIPFVTSGLEFVPLPVIHGEDYICLGFLFGRKSKVAYISDVSRFPPSTEHAISKSGGGQLDLLILDCLSRTLDAVKRICPKRALLIGMTDEMDHHKDNETLEEWSRREGIDVQLARDGSRVYIDLCNTSLLIDYCQDEVTHKYILIDVGKTFREQIILTHEHADAILGLDDVRIVQPFSPTNDIEPTPIYLSQFAMNSIAQKFPYLVRKKLKEGEEVRRVAQLDWRVIESDLQKPFVTSGLEFVPLPVIHGEDYVCLGFLFGRKSKVAYISDVSRFPPSTEHAISKSGEGQLDLLILDCLYRGICFFSNLH